MKKLLSVVVVVLITLSVKAQSTYVQGGVNLANITKDSDGATDKNNVLTSFNAGILHRFNVAPVFAIETGLLFTGKGAKAERYFNGGTDYVKSKFNPYYIELPLNFVAKFPFTANTSLFAYGGPYAAIGVAGKSKTETKVLSIYSTEEHSIDFSNDDPFTSEEEGASYDRLKRFDYGLNFGAGFAFQRIIFKANYGLGLAKINSTEDNNDANEKNKYRTVSFSVGIPLGK